MKELRVLPLFPPGMEQGYPYQYVTGTHFYTWVEKDNVALSFKSAETAMAGTMP